MGWLKIMYIWTIVIAGVFGLGMIFVPNAVQAMYESTCDPVTYGIEASIFVAFAILAIFGLRAPLKFVPILFIIIGDLVAIPFPYVLAKPSEG